MDGAQPPTASEAGMVSCSTESSVTSDAEAGVVSCSTESAVASNVEAGIVSCSTDRPVAPDTLAEKPLSVHTPINAKSYSTKQPKPSPSRKSERPKQQSVFMNDDLIKAPSKAIYLSYSELKSRLASQEKLYNNKVLIGKLRDNGEKIKQKIDELRREVTRRDVEKATAEFAGLSLNRSVHGEKRVHSDAPYKTITGTLVQPQTKEISLEASMALEVEYNLSEKESMTQRAMKRMSLKTEPRENLGDHVAGDSEDED
eukprot:CFRG4665T1